MENVGQKHIAVRTKDMLKRLFKNSNIMFVQLPDKYSIKADFVPSQPANFMVMYAGNRSAFMEYKWVDDGKQFSLMMFNPYQTKFIERCVADRIPYIVVLENTLLNEYYIFDIKEVWQRFVDSDRTIISFSWEDLKEYCIDKIEDVIIFLKGLD